MAPSDGEATLRQFSASDRDDFERCSNGLRDPVHIRGLGREFVPASWTLDRLREAAGECSFRVARNDEQGRWLVNKEGRHGPDWEDVVLREFLDILGSGDHRGFYAASVAIDRFPPLRHDAEQVPFLPWVGDPAAAQIRFWLGRDNATQLHYDMFHTFLAPVIGSKDVWLFAPSALADFYPMQDARNCNVSRVCSPKVFDRNAFPAFATKAPIRLKVSPGEAVFIPVYWWHYVEAGPEVNLALSYHFARPTVETLRSEYLLHFVRSQAGNA